MKEQKWLKKIDDKHNLLDRRFGMLLVISYDGIRAKESSGKRVTERYWNCICDCGNKISSACSRLTAGDKTNCGCKKSGSTNPCWKGYKEISGHFWASIKRKDRKLEFTITLEYVWDLFLKQDRKCALSGIPIGFTQTIASRSYQTASLDRIDSSKGYIEGNVQWLHKHINRLKNNYNQDNFITMCNLVAQQKPIHYYQLLPLLNYKINN